MSAIPLNAEHELTLDSINAEEGRVTHPPTMVTGEDAMLDHAQLKHNGRG